MKLPGIWDNPYNKINLIFAGIIISIFIYSAAFSAGKSNHPVQCVHEKITGKPCPTCGLSNSFSELIRLRIDSAKEWNQNGIPIFLFFLIQLFLRTGIIILVQKQVIVTRKIVIADVSFSLLLFIISFRRLLTFWTFYS
jgi:hypothetical protein